MSSWMNRTYQGLHDQCVQTRSYLDANFGTFGIQGTSAGWINNTFKPALDRYVWAFAAWQNESTRTPAIIARIQTARDELMPLYRELYAFLRGNPVVTDADLLAMALPRRPQGSNRTPVPVPTSHPVVAIDIATLRQLTLRFVDSESGRRGRPHGVAGAVIRWAILQEAPYSIEALRNTALDTQTPFTLSFAENQRHQTVYFCLAWQNTRGEMGPWGEIVSAVIP